MTNVIMCLENQDKVVSGSENITLMNYSTGQKSSRFYIVLQCKNVNFFWPVLYFDLYDVLLCLDVLLSSFRMILPTQLQISLISWTA